MYIYWSLKLQYQNEWLEISHTLCSSLVSINILNYMYFFIIFKRNKFLPVFIHHKILSSSRMVSRFSLLFHSTSEKMGFQAFIRYSSTSDNVIWFGSGLSCLTPLSTKFRLYRGDQFYWWGKLEYPEKTTGLTEVTDKC